MIIDAHEHVIIPMEKQKHLMDEAGISHVILFSTSVHPEQASDLPSLSLELEKLQGMMEGRINSVTSRIHAAEELANAVRIDPSHFHGFGPVPLGLSDREYRSWIETYITAYHFLGIGELLPPPGQAEVLEPLFRVSGEFGNLPLWIHTFNPLGRTDIQKILDMAARYPHIPVIIGHLGGSYWLDVLKSIRSLTNVYLDLSALFTTMALVYAVREYPGRTFFSSDAPYARPLSCLTVFRQNIQDPAVQKRVCGENIAELLSLNRL